MLWYDAFNLCEAVLWGFVAGVVFERAPVASGRQRVAVLLGSLAFILFGLTDVLESGTGGLIPLWLWSVKVGCGVMILAARYHWRGWTTFRWRDREVLFALACLTAVATIVTLQLRFATD